ncbi:hypothetical protein NDU88_000949 [Pleurodeles waltl]|uniref:Uncharacterized protein n=1 Tax=Pleurodeles waltl TaxID=8319 RepID=A0AAV7VZN2_PLEWA|nr:hypothetical protein NDU88_000949 [Pleurodeles waltl]
MDNPSWTSAALRHYPRLEQCRLTVRNPPSRFVPPRVMQRMVLTSGITVITIRGDTARKTSSKVPPSSSRSFMGIPARFIKSKTVLIVAAALHARGCGGD